MTDTAADDPGGRGSLDIADKVVDKIAKRTASTVDGVVRTGSGLGQLVGRSLPSASCTVTGDRVRISLDIAVAWPLDLAEVSGSVRDAVGRDVTALAGMHVLGVDVSVSRVEHPSATSQGRVR